MTETFTPENESELADLIRGAEGAFEVRGGGTRASGASGNGACLGTSGLSGITLYEPGALTMVARAGTPLAEIEAALDAEGQMLPFEPYLLGGVTGSDGASTIGGVFATNASGARRVQAGAARDLLLGVRFVDGRGEVVENGGRVMKNVTGYDLVKLMAGSRGTLGVLSEVSFKVLPKPEASASLEIAGLSDEDAVRAMASARTSPFDVSGAIHAPDAIEEEPTTLIRVEGFADSVAYRAEQLKARLSTFGAAEIVDGREAWDAEQGMTAFGRTVRGQGGALWMVSVKPSDAPGLMARLCANHACLYSYDWAGGRIWVWLGAEGDQMACHHRLQGLVAETSGFANLVSGPQELADAVPHVQPEHPVLAALSEGLREKFDPRSVFNPEGRI